jgi:chitinase
MMINLQKSLNNTTMKKCLFTLTALLMTLAGCAKKNAPCEEKVVVAYVTSWTRVMPDPDRVTHINYAFGHVNDTFDGVRIDNESRLKRIIALKNESPSLNICLSVGGWGSGRFSEMAADETLRKSFATDCARAVKEFGLDGIDIDWEYPTSDMAGISASADDRENFNLLMRDLRSVLGTDRFLTLASSAYAEYIDFRSCIDYLDFVNVMTYDMANAPFHHAALYASENTKGCCDGAVKAHMEAGVPACKLVLGVPFYGRGGTPKMRSRDYKSIKEEGEFVLMWDEKAQAPYVADGEGNFVLGYDNPRSLKIKCDYIKANGLHGAMYWDYAGDNEAGDLQKTLAGELL